MSTTMGRMDAATATRSRRSKHSSHRVIGSKFAGHLRKRQAAIARKTGKTDCQA